MDLKDFIKKVLEDIVSAVEEVRISSSRDMYLKEGRDNRTVEFDIGVIVEDSSSSAGKASIRVPHLIEGGGDISKEFKNSSISRVKFGVYISTLTKNEEGIIKQQIQSRRENNINFE